MQVVAASSKPWVKWGLPLMRVLYDLAWLILIFLGSPWWVTRSIFSSSFRSMVAGRLALFAPHLGPPTSRGRILLHGVSVGEVKASQSLVAALEVDHEVVVSASTDSGLKVAQDLYPHLTVVRFPIDFRPAVLRFLGCVQPTAVLLLELEVWPNFVHCTHRRGLPTAIVSGRITPSSLENYQRFGPILTHFDRIELFAAQSETYARRFRSLGADSARILVTGNVKVDGLRTSTSDQESHRGRELRELLALESGVPVVLAGSTHEGEEVLVLDAFSAAAPAARLILVPRHPPRVPEILRTLQAKGYRPQLLTDLRAGKEGADPRRPLIVDTIGELEALYGLCTVAFVGGTLVEHGGQNVLEPAAQGKPVLHGPSVANFSQETTLLAQVGASRQVKSGAELEAAVGELLGDPGKAQAMGQAGRKAVEGQRGATGRTLAALEQFGIVPSG